MIDRRFIGWKSEPVVVEVEKGQLRLFAEATGETNLIYFDEEAAKAAGHPSLPAPPTFAFCLFNLAGQPYSYLRLMGVDIACLLHGEQAFEYLAPYYAGDALTLATEIADITTKKNGALDLVEARTDAINQRGQLCVKQRTVLIVRNESKL
ncbi:MAG TPA: MaoC family dehydratase N-terminal domain-containing protein [Terricaulis sp.]|jgi:Acyl dehydratase|nr:MaoC family dehydratase N-terminal domain-containing protein [Terricaulis sp.]